MSTSQPESLRQVAQLASTKHNGAGGREVERIASKAGYQITFTTFDRMIAGKYNSRASRKTLEALAYLSGLPLERIYEVAGQRYSKDRFADQLPPEIDLLTDDQRNAVITVARAFLNANRELEGLQHELEDKRKEDSAPRTPLYAVEDADGEDAGEEQKIKRAAHHNLDPEIGPEDLPHET